MRQITSFEIHEGCWKFPKFCWSLPAFQTRSYKLWDCCLPRSGWPIQYSRQSFACLAIIINSYKPNHVYKSDVFIIKPFTILCRHFFASIPLTFCFPSSNLHIAGYFWMAFLLEWWLLYAGQWSPFPEVSQPIPLLNLFSIQSKFWSFQSTSWWLQGSIGRLIFLFYGSKFWRIKFLQSSANPISHSYHIGKLSSLQSYRPSADHQRRLLKFFRKTLLRIFFLLKLHKFGPPAVSSWKFEISVEGIGQIPGLLLILEWLSTWEEDSLLP